MGAWLAAGGAAGRKPLEPDSGQTHLTYTERGVHFDGLDSPEDREEGTSRLLDQLGSHLPPGRPGFSTVRPVPKRNL